LSENFKEYFLSVSLFIGGKVGPKSDKKIASKPIYYEKGLPQLSSLFILLFQDFQVIPIRSPIAC